ncbi:MAG: hypothetical protein HYY18_04945 [Planctomycetes bacterium]|nr:hypothetical protein [Planctomycetota bacterium]
MPLGLKIGIGVVLLAAGGGAGWYFLAPVEEEPLPPVSDRLIEELIAQRDHVRLVVGGRLMAEIFPCG